MLRKLHVDYENKLNQKDLIISEAMQKIDKLKVSLQNQSKSNILDQFELNIENILDNSKDMGRKLPNPMFK